ncbi:MAG: NAD-dependent epimerase/dehydratase family protein [Dermatophilaceae bacterium]
MTSTDEVVRPRHVLVAGAAGRIGVVVSAGLDALGYRVSRLDISTPSQDTGSDAWFRIDLTDPAAVDATIAECRPDAVVHVAGSAGERPLAESWESHVVSTAALLQAMRRHAGRRIVYASSNHAVGHLRRRDAVRIPVPADVSPRPDTYYGVAKAGAEALLSLWADRAGIEVVVCRIGSFAPRPRSRRALATWLSHGDSVRMTHAALTASLPAGAEYLWGISANTRAWWDLEAGRRLGYDPHDDAEAYAHDVDDSPSGPEATVEDELLGGAFAAGYLTDPIG